MKLAPRQQKAVELLACGLSIREVAAQVGVHERTVRRWINQPNVAEALAELQWAAWRHALRRLRALADRAVDVLRDVLRDPEVPAATRVGAAKAVFEIVRNVALEDLQERLARLEAYAAELLGKNET